MITASIAVSHIIVFSVPSHFLLVTSSFYPLFYCDFMVKYKVLIFAKFPIFSPASHPFRSPTSCPFLSLLLYSCHPLFSQGPNPLLSPTNKVNLQQLQRIVLLKKSGKVLYHTVLQLNQSTNRLQCNSPVNFTGSVQPGSINHAF